MKNKKGFTLIELLVVVLVIGILAAIAIPQYQTAVAKSRATEALIVGKNMRTALEEYYLINDKYLASFADMTITVPAAETCNARSGSEDCLTNQKMNYVLHDNGLLQIVDVNYNFTIEIYPSKLWDGRTRRLANKNKETYKKACIALGEVYSNTTGGYEYYDFP
jgi:prepilin-type N-terminal cleavage/methylation domain-containing protein